MDKNHENSMNLIKSYDKSVHGLYIESVKLVEKLHRRLLDIIKDEFERRARSDINPVQALLLFNMGNAEMTAGEVRSRGYYFGSNVSYNLKRLHDSDFIHHQRSGTDRRLVRVSLTEKGQEVAKIVQELYKRHTSSIAEAAGMGEDEFAQMNRCLQRLDRFWSDAISYRM